MQELLAAIQAGREGAFNELYNRLWEPFYLFAFKPLKHHEDAKEVVQSTGQQVVLVKPGEPYSTDPVASRGQMQFDIRYSWQVDDRDGYNSDG